MSTNLAGAINTGQLGACIVRVATLDADCTPTGGTNGGIVSAALATATATPDVAQGKTFEPETACGYVPFTYERGSRIKRYNITGEMYFFDFELMLMLFGGSLILGKAGGTYAGKVIGHAMPKYNDTPNNGVYLEIIVQAVAEGAGDCISSSAASVAWVGYVFGKCRLVPGARTFEDDVAKVLFDGTVTNNPNLYDGPWNDYPGAGYAPDSPVFQVGYSQAEYDAIAATVSPGYQNLATGS